MGSVPLVHHFYPPPFFSFLCLVIKSQGLVTKSQGLVTKSQGLVAKSQGLVA